MPVAVTACGSGRQALPCGCGGDWVCSAHLTPVPAGSRTSPWRRVRVISNTTSTWGSSATENCASGAIEFEMPGQGNGTTHGCYT